MEERVFGVSSEEGKGHLYPKISSGELGGWWKWVWEVEVQVTEEQKVFEHRVALHFKGPKLDHDLPGKPFLSVWFPPF